MQIDYNYIHYYVHICHLSCWNSDLQYVHFTIGWAMRHSCVNKAEDCQLPVIVQ